MCCVLATAGLTGVQDVFGTKRMLVCEVWVFILGNIIAGTARTLSQLVAGRMIAGVGGAGLLSLCTIIVSRKHSTIRGHTREISDKNYDRIDKRTPEEYISQPHQCSIHRCGLTWTDPRWVACEVWKLAMDVSRSIVVQIVNIPTILPVSC